MLIAINDLNDDLNDTDNKLALISFYISNDIIDAAQQKVTLRVHLFQTHQNLGDFARPPINCRV
jgi:subtilisin-like proprotein convertase family protein